jgi:hypothetical protein
VEQQTREREYDGRRGRRRRRTVLAVAAATVVAAVAVAGAFGLGGGEERGPDAPPRAGSLVPVERATLTERTTVDGRLGYGAELPLPLKANGTVTWLPEQGALVGRGEQLIRVDDRPVVLLYGSLPMYRALGLGSVRSSGREGADSPAASSPPLEMRGMDVLQFESNLAALGYSGFTVDETFSGEFAGAVGLGEVVVGAQVQAEEEVLLGAAGGEQQDRDVRLGAQDAAHVEAVDQRQHHVEHDEVGADAAGAVQCRTAVGGDLHRVALPLQIDADQPGLLLVVLGDQYPRGQQPSPGRFLRIPEP